MLYLDMSDQITPQHRQGVLGTEIRATIISWIR